MIKILNKVPQILYTIIVILISIALTHYLEVHLISIKWITAQEGEARVALYSSVLTIIGIFYGVIQLQSQKKDSLLANEYINQPDFAFFAFGNGSTVPLSSCTSPGCCCTGNQPCSNNCIDEHWFVIKQIGNLPATDISISMFHSKEQQNICCDDKIKKIDTLVKNDTFQYKLPPYSYDENFLDRTSNGFFVVLISYKSLYSNLRYKRVYHLAYSPSQDTVIANGLWGNNIKFFSVKLFKITDYNSLRFRDIIIGNMLFYLFKLNIKSTYTERDWIMKY